MLKKNYINYNYMEHNQDVTIQNTKNLQYCYDLTSDVGVHALISKTKYNRIYTRYDKDVIDLYRRSNYKVDYYLTINTFKSWSHSLNDIKGLNGNFIDIDTEVHGIKQYQFIGFLDYILDELDYPPKYVLWSGHGFYFVFPYEYQVIVNHPCMITLWNLVEDKIIDSVDHILYQYFGIRHLCDSKASDCSRALRMPGTRNYKIREDIRHCDVIKINNIKSQYEFFDLVDNYLPKYDKTKTNRHYRRNHGLVNNKYNPKSLKVGRTNDLKKLVRLRNYDLTNMREVFLFIFACNAGFYMSNNETIEEITSINNELVEPLPEREIRSLTTEIERLDLTKWQHKNERIIKDLEICDDEERQLKVVISIKEKYRRRNSKRSQSNRSSEINKKKARRRIQSSQKKRKKTFRNNRIIKLHQKGVSSRQIVKLVNVSRSTVMRVLRTRK